MFELDFVLFGISLGVVSLDFAFDFSVSPSLSFFFLDLEGEEEACVCGVLLLEPVSESDSVVCVVYIKVGISC